MRDSSLSAVNPSNPEPVAYRWKLKTMPHWRYEENIEHFSRRGEGVIEPLYSHPPVSAEREALEKARKIADEELRCWENDGRVLSSPVDSHKVFGAGDWL